MQKIAALSSLLTLGLLLALPSVSWSQNTSNPAFDGSFQIGFRMVDVNGREEKYREDIGLEDGPRLFNLNLDYVPGDAVGRFADTVNLDINNFGGDPFETLSLGVQKFGHYNLRYDRRKSNYFYDDIILASGSSGEVDPVPIGDFHTFSFDRVMDRANLDIDITKAAKFNFGFNRFTKQGGSTTTLDISRDEFELDKPVDESLSDYIAGFQYAWKKVTLVLEERYRDYENVIEMFLPGQSTGHNPDDPTTLDFFFLNQPYDFTSNDHTAKIVARPSRKLLLRAAGTLQSLDMNIEADEQSQGIAFTGAPFETDIVGDGDIQRDVELFDLELTYQFNPTWALLASARRNELDQDGKFNWDNALNEGRWKIETDIYGIGGEFSPMTSLTVSGGVRDESRKVDSYWAHGDDTSYEHVTTDQTAFWVVAGWRPTKRLNFSAEIEDASYDNPYTSASPTDRSRYRLRLRYNQDKGFWVGGSYLGSKFENTNSGWDANFDQFDIHAGYHAESVDAAVGYNNIQIERSIDQQVTAGGGGFLFPVFYDADADFVDGRVRWTANQRFALGGDFRLYENTGSFGVDRTDYRGWIEIGFLQNYLVHLGYRTVDYKQSNYSVDDYDADIAEISVGYRW